MTFPITGFYTGMLGLIMIVLQVLVVVARARNDTLFGSGGKIEMLLPMRRHGNFIETVPFILILMMMVEMMNYAPWILHAFGLLLMASRLFHFVGLNQSSGVSKGRLAAGLITMGLVVAGSLLLLYTAVVKGAIFTL